MHVCCGLVVLKPRYFFHQRRESWEPLPTIVVASPKPTAEIMTRWCDVYIYVSFFGSIIRDVMIIMELNVFTCLVFVKAVGCVQDVWSWSRVWLDKRQNNYKWHNETLVAGRYLYVWFQLWCQKGSRVFWRVVISRNWVNVIKVQFCFTVLQPFEILSRQTS